MECFDFLSRVLLKGVIYGVSMEIEAQCLKRDVPGVVEAHHLNRMVDGRKNKSLSMLLLFDEEFLSTHVKLGYTGYVVRAFEKRPLQCRNCKKFCHVASVCKRSIYIYYMLLKGQCIHSAAIVVGS